MRCNLSILLVVVLASSTLRADWPQFRGPDGQGHSDADGVPLTWSESKNITWKTTIPGQGWSSPVIAGNQVWLTTALEGGRSLRAFCVDKATGRPKASVELFKPKEPGSKHVQNGYASPTPVIDGDRIYAYFGPRGVACIRKDGAIVWTRKPPPHVLVQGAASSPIIWRDLLILTCDGIDNQFLLALDKNTGQTRWKQARAHLERAAKKNKIAKMSYSTPLVQQVGDTYQLVSGGADHVAAYDVTTGKELWWKPYDGFSIVCRPSYGHGLFYVIGSIKQDHFSIYALRPGTGELKGDSIVWENSKNMPHVPSPLLIGKELYIFDDKGIATCFDALTGKVHWKERIGGNYRASPIAVRDRIYIPNREGKTIVLEAGKRFKKLATNHLDGVLLASPAVSDGALFLRSDEHLYRIDD